MEQNSLAEIVNRTAATSMISLYEAYERLGIPGRPTERTIYRQVKSTVDSDQRLTLQEPTLVAVA